MNSKFATPSQTVSRENQLDNHRFVFRDWLWRSNSIHITVFLLSVIILLTSFVPPILTMKIPRNGQLLISIGEIADLFTPFFVTSIAICLMWQIYVLKTAIELSISDLFPMGLFVFSAILMINGHGIHLSANSLSHLIEQGSGISYKLNYLFDEIISHYMWHVGAFCLSMSVAIFQLKYPTMVNRRAFIILLFSASVYAFTFTFATIEGGTMLAITPLSISSLFAFVFVIARYKLSLSERPVVVFFLLTSILMLFGWTAYSIAFAGFPSPVDMLKNR